MNIDIILCVDSGHITETPIRVFATWNSPGIPIRTFATWNSNSGSQNLLRGRNLLNPCDKSPPHPPPCGGGAWGGGGGVFEARIRKLLP